MNPNSNHENVENPIRFATRFLLLFVKNFIIICHWQWYNSRKELYSDFPKYLFYLPFLTGRFGNHLGNKVD
ncbi:hypothetical protein BLA29_012361 [Euroglyphus maynei]|uniref:Uncharacterized protein n=1 Tax=Euroglyphus maynei TaxID=6958 RepID=A0A1Y3BP98_EURMA|nr:hypothetical protein BLA29_012361 [Euroglyphus maynei]